MYRSLSKIIVNNLLKNVELTLVMQQFVDYNDFVEVRDGSYRHLIRHTANVPNPYFERSEIVDSPLKAKRKQFSMTQKEVAKRLGIKVQSYSHYENKKRQPRIEVMRQIAELFNSSLDELFF